MRLVFPVLVAVMCVAACGGDVLLTPEQAAVFAAAVREEAAVAAPDARDHLDRLATALERGRTAGIMAALDRARRGTESTSAPRLAALLNEIGASIEEADSIPARGITAPRPEPRRQ